MEVLALYNRIRAMWPKEVDISDGHPVGETGYSFPTLSSIRWGITDKIDHKNDHWGSIGTWCFWSAVHAKATELHRRGERALSIDSISVASFDQYMKSNLEAEDWAQERKEYKGL
jgi:hypothetical protein